MSANRGIALAELLIVLAVLAVLALAAIPHYHAAQARSTYSLVQEDLRVVAAAIESYTLDYGAPPFDWADDVNFPYYLHSGIYSPVAYATGPGKLKDRFAPEEDPGSIPIPVRDRIRYRAFGESYLSGGASGAPFQTLPGPTASGMEVARQAHGDWFLVSRGPDDSWLPLPLGFQDGRNQQDWLWLIYDPTNGAESRGNVIRNQRRGHASMGDYPFIPEYQQPPPPAPEE